MIARDASSALHAYSLLSTMDSSSSKGVLDLRCQFPSFNNLSHRAFADNAGQNRRILTHRFFTGHNVTDSGRGSVFTSSRKVSMDAQLVTGSDIAPEMLHLAEAQTGFAMVIHMAGISLEDSHAIVSNAPITVQSLVNSALELNELATWTNEHLLQHQSFEQKVLHVAMANPSRQFAALFESVGVQQRCISLVCHFVASQSLTDVLSKIKLLESIFTDVEDTGIIIRTRRMMHDMSLSTDGGLQKTLSFFEKMEAKQGGINILNVPRHALPNVIEEFPQVLARDLDTDMKALFDYFEEIAVPKESIPSVLVCFPSILLYRSIEEFRSRLRTLKKEASVRPKNFGRMITKYPWILSRSVEDNVTLVAKFLMTIKVSPAKVGSCVTKCPNLLGSSTRSLQVMVEQLRSMGLRNRAIGGIIVHYPQLLLKGTRSFLEIVKFLRSLGLEESDIPKILLKCPPVFASAVSHLRKKVTFLQQLGIRNHRLTSVLRRYPQVLMLSVEKALMPRLDFLKSVGLSNQDIAFMICGFPPLLGYSIDDVLKPKFEVLQNVLGHPVEEVVSYPRYFSYCIQKKILPRYRVMKRLSMEWDLKSLLSMNDDQFAQDYLGFGRMLVPPV